MDPFFSDFLDRMQDLHTTMRLSIADLPLDALNWVPGEEMNSIAVLVTHLTGAERYWVGDVAMGDPSNRVRASEFEVGGLDAQTLISRLQDSFDYMSRAVAGLSVADLAGERTAPSHRGQFTVGWALLHALEHTAVHTGHIELTSQLWRQTQSA